MNDLSQEILAREGKAISRLTDLVERCLSCYAEFVPVQGLCSCLSKELCCPEDLPVYFFKELCYTEDLPVYFLVKRCASTEDLPVYFLVTRCAILRICLFIF